MCATIRAPSSSRTGIQHAAPQATTTRWMQLGAKRNAICKTPAHNISEMYCRFLALCARLQLKAGSRNPFIGAQKRFGKLLGCDYTTIGSYIKCAIKDGLLVRVKPCVPHSRAAEYVYSGPGLSY